MTSLANRIQGGLFLSSMMGWTTGDFVAQRGRGAAMVQIGALIADAEDRSHDSRFLLPLEENDMVPVLAAAVQAAREGVGDTPIALNGAVGDVESGCRMARAFREAGGDLFELNCHGGYGKLLERGLLRAMALPTNRPTLIEWLEALCELDIPIVVKFHGHMEGVNLAEVLRDMAHIERLFGVHFNVRSVEGKQPDVDLVRRLRPLARGVLFCSGHVRSREQADALFRAGADCVGLAQAVLDDPQILERLAAR